MSEATATSHAHATKSWAGVFAPHDVLLIAYFVIIRLLVWLSPATAVRDRVSLHIDLALLAVAAGCVGARALNVWSPRVRAFAYKLCLMGVGLEAYLMLRDLLPLVRADSVDATLLAIDTWLFGGEPAVWLQRFNHPPLVEYFAFFYFSYYFILVAYVGTILWTSRRPEANTELAVGAFTVMVVGHLGYMAVPGFGPVTYMADQFQAPLQGGFFWSCVWSTVQAGGAMKDIFPSLHTAFPTYFALYALRQSRIDRRWRWPAIVTGFFACNIIISTVFLRWHYAIDLFAGLALASFAAWVGPRLAQWDVRFREARGLPPAWSFEVR